MRLGGTLAHGGFSIFCFLLLIRTIPGILNLSGSPEKRCKKDQDREQLQTTDQH